MIFHTGFIESSQRLLRDYKEMEEAGLVTDQEDLIESLGDEDLAVLEVIIRRALNLPVTPSD